MKSERVSKNSESTERQDPQIKESEVLVLEKVITDEHQQTEESDGGNSGETNNYVFSGGGMHIGSNVVKTSYVVETTSNIIAQNVASNANSDLK